MRVIDTYTDTVIADGWRRGVLLADICRETRLGHHEVMDRVRALGLPDRDPASREIVEGRRVPPEARPDPYRMLPVIGGRGGAGRVT